MGIGGYHEGATGSMTRIFSTFLTWMQEHKAQVFVAATANRINLLPAEILRKGRFDQVFFVDLPADEERKEILNIHLRRNGLDPATYDLILLASATRGWNGAEIEQAAIQARVTAHAKEHRGHTKRSPCGIWKNYPSFSNHGRTDQGHQILGPHSCPPRHHTRKAEFMSCGPFKRNPVSNPFERPTSNVQRSTLKLAPPGGGQKAFSAKMQQQAHRLSGIRSWKLDVETLSVHAPLSESQLQMRTETPPIIRLLVRPGQGGARLDLFLPDAAGLSRRRSRALIAEGAVWRNGQAIRVQSRILDEGDVIDIVSPDVTLEDTTLATRRNRSGLRRPLVGRGEQERRRLDPAVREQPDRRAGARPTPPAVDGLSGRAKTLPPNRPSPGPFDVRPGRFCQQPRRLRHPWIHRGVAEQWIVFTWHWWRRVQRKTRASLTLRSTATGTIPGDSGVDRRGKASRTHFKVLHRADHWAAVLCRLETGRTHQVRVHLAHLGHPVLGDHLYGSTSRDAPRPLLHAWALAFPSSRRPVPSSTCSTPPLCDHDTTRRSRTQRSLEPFLAARYW